MKVVVGQSSIVRLVAKLLGGSPRQARKEVGPVHSLDTDQLRQVSGGNGASTQAPNKGW
jgi:hypothetical protein